MPPKESDPVDRILARIDRTAEHWDWPGAVASEQRRPVIYAWGKKRYVARILFEHFVRPLREGEQINHTCDYPPCCNPAHLYAGTQSQNLRDRYTRTEPRGKTCGNGHEWTPENTILRVRMGKDGLPWNSHDCRQCGREAQRRYQARKKAASRT